MNTIKRIKDPKVAAEIVEKALNLIVDNPNNLSIIKNANKDYIRNFIQNVVTGKITEYFLIGFYDNYDEENEELVGACLLSTGNPWYDPNLLIVNEEFTVSFKKGAGIARRLSEYLKDILNYSDDVSFVQTGSVNDWCAPMLRNSYKKAGFHIYNQYYLSKEDLNEFLWQD